ncbi:hypothetical protein [Bacillus weihaiensis]|uniref:Uncharacterized protein n=1 Tax=Bacillus weihaiensis TaxID=1547283 RepID=A0A1L3MLR3_9BACI|nr:hypothetical protein [Bacillus weihaiensis]APH03283.1 hypothetical protein A9C19_00120 [Bacillus weihaiensis]
MNYKERLMPFLASNDYFIHEFISQSLHDFPDIHFTKALLKEIKKDPIKESIHLMYLNVENADEEVVFYLAEGANHSNPSIAELYQQLIPRLSPDVAMAHMPLIKPFLSEDTWMFYERLMQGNEDELWPLFFDLLASVHENEDLYVTVKQLAATLVRNGWVSEEIIELIFHENEKQEWFDYNGMIAIYMMKLMGLNHYSERLATLLTHEGEDMLLDEVSATLISFQSSNVVEAVAPYLIEDIPNIYAISILENLKQKESVEVLSEAYKKVQSPQAMELLIEALAHQLDPDAEPVIHDYLKSDPTYSLVDVPLIAYAYYQIIGVRHPMLGEWREDLHSRG